MLKLSVMSIIIIMIIIIIVSNLNRKEDIVIPERLQR